MNIAGTYQLDAPAERVWPLIFDPAELLQLIPGCEQIEQICPGEYRGRLNLRIAAVGGTFQTTLKVIDYQPPVYSRFEGEAAGPGGVIKGQAAFVLSPQLNCGENERPQTQLAYEGQALITGPLGSLNSWLVEGVAQALIHQGLEKLNARLQDQAASSSMISQTDRTAGRGNAWRRLIGWIKSFIARLRHSPQVT